MINLVSFLEAFCLFLQLLNQDLILLLIIFNISIDPFDFGFESLHVELYLVQLLILIICDVIQYFAFKLLQRLFDIFWRDFFDKS
jgi:hypothetical protein